MCGHTVRAFRPHGGGQEVLERRRVVGGMLRLDDRCPICHSCDRTRLMMLYLQREAAVGSQRLDLLHVAPDLGLYLWLRRQASVNYCGTDLDSYRYRHISGLKRADLTNLPFAAKSFDVVVCSHVLEHVPDDAAALREIRRVLRPGGEALLLAPFATDGGGTREDPSVTEPAERERRFGQWDHVRLYDRDDFMARVTDAGLEVSAFDPFERWPREAECLSLNPLEILPIGRRPPESP
jgi:SAM-dependent methyltransferase